MRPSLVRAFAVHPKYSAQRSLRGRFGARHSTIPVLVKHGESGRRRSSGTPGRRGAGEGEGNFSDDIADLNAEIGGFVGDLGDPDFDTTAPSGPRTDAQDAPDIIRGNKVQPYGTPTERQAARIIGSKPPLARLTQADHPLAARIPGLDAEPGQPDWSASLVTGRRQDCNETRGVKSVLVLNGAACFIAGKLASTGEPRGAITKSMEAAAEELNLSLTVCTSNREDELLDKLCEGGYDAIVYNPSGFQVSGLQDSGFRDAHPTAGVSSAAADPDAVVQAEGGEGNGSRQRFLRDGYQKRDGRGRAIEYGLARAGCPVVFVSPRDDTAPGTRMPAGKLGGGAISGFSGVVSYRLAMVAVASVLDDRR